MTDAKPNVIAVDPVWDRIRREATVIIEDEPVMASLVHSVILSHSTLEVALSHRIAHRLASGEMTESILHNAFEEAYAAGCRLGDVARSDVLAVFERDPACHRYIQPLLFYKGFQAIQAYRLAHWFWMHERENLAYFMQMRTSEVFGVDIHPAAKIGRGLMIDHAHSVVIGETA
ncbi:MAG: serine O-acetyltransferase, partial [Paracoccaceae bacterium]